MDAEAPSVAPLDISSEEKPKLHTCCLCCGTCCGLAVLLALLATVSCSFSLSEGWLSFLQADRPPLTGSYKVGVLRGRLPAAGERACGLYVQLSYPIAEGAEEFPSQWFPRWRDVVIDKWAPGLECAGEALLGGQGPLDPQGKPMASPEGGWPVVIHSAGLQGSVEVYQQLSRDIASTGAIVVALEHEDGAGSHAIDCDGNQIDFTRRAEGEGEGVFRRRQLEVRLVEMNATLEAVLAAIGALAPGASPIEQVLNFGSAEKLVLTGHSFGGCSSFYYLETLAKANVTPPVLGAIFFDQWTAPYTEENYSVPIGVPLVQITSEFFVSIPTISAINEINAATLLAAARVRGTVHAWVSESQLVMRHWVTRRLPGWIGPGDYFTVFGDTMQAVRDSMEAFLDPALGPALSATILRINPEVIVPLIAPEAIAPLAW